jgi:hypothetical protein
MIERAEWGRGEKIEQHNKKERVEREEYERG